GYGGGGQKLVRTLVRNRNLVRQDLRGPETLVRSEEEDLVFLDGTADATAELVPAKRRRVRAIEEVARFQFIVAQEFECGAVERVCAGVAGCVDDGSVAAELRTVSIGQRLELSDG